VLIQACLTWHFDFKTVLSRRVKESGTITPADLISLLSLSI